MKHLGVGSKESAVTLTACLGIICLLEDLVFTSDLFTVIPLPFMSEHCAPPQLGIDFHFAGLNFVMRVWLLCRDDVFQIKGSPGHLMRCSSGDRQGLGPD